MSNAAENAGLDVLVHELDILIRARYPFFAVNTFEEGRFLWVMTDIASSTVMRGGSAIESMNT